MKTIPCPQCNKLFVDDYALRQHLAAKHGGTPIAPRRKQGRAERIPGISNKKVAFETWQSATADMSDGVAFAMLEQFGLTMDDVIVEAERQNAERT